MLTQIYNANILLPGGRWMRNGSIVIDDGKIVEVCDHSRIFESVERRIDACCGYVMPGGIDLHVHGGGGRDFQEATADAFATVVETHRRHGTTSMFPTLASCSRQTIIDAAAICSDMMADPRSGVLGLHIEGPYFNPKMAGGQMGEFMREPCAEEYVGIVEQFPCIKRWDASPEVRGACDFARYIKSKGIIAGIAHTTADYEAVRAAYDSGFSFATHFYNAMTSCHKEGIYKHEGTVESIYLVDGINVEVIADGIHVPPVILRLIHKFKGASRMCLVTDALSCAGSKTNEVFDPRVIIEDGVCMLSDHSAIAGSVATMDRLIQTAAHKAQIPLEDVSRMVSETPARIMGVYDRKGSISKHKDADIIIMDEHLNLTHVIAMGQLRYLFT